LRLAVETFLLAGTPISSYISLDSAKTSLLLPRIPQFYEKKKLLISHPEGNKLSGIQYKITQNYK